MNKTVLATLLIAILLILTACASDRPREDTEESTSLATVYGQIAISGDYISTD